MNEWTRFKDKLPTEGQAIKVRNQWPFTLNAHFRKHELGYALVELRAQARLVVREFKPNAIWMPIEVKEMANE